MARVLSELPKEQIEEGMKQMCVQQVHLLAQVNRHGRVNVLLLLFIIIITIYYNYYYYYYVLVTF